MVAIARTLELCCVSCPDPNSAGAYIASDKALHARQFGYGYARPATHAPLQWELARPRFSVFLCGGATTKKNRKSGLVSETI